MTNYTYPAPSVVVAGGTTIEISQFLKNPNLIRRRLQTLVAQKFIADYLLPQRFQAVGGSILYETGESLFPDGTPEAIAPGAEYPLTTVQGGLIAAAHSVKWGEDAKVTDESISRFNFNPVERSLTKLANGMVRQVDSTALGVIASKTTQEFAAVAAWNAAAPIIDSVLQADAEYTVQNLEYGTYDYDTVVLSPLQFAKVAGTFLTSTLLPRESGNEIVSGVLENYLGKNWVTSKYVPVTDPLLVDTDQLGGMADENIESPGYSTSNQQGAPGVQAKSIREDDLDQWRLRVRRVTVPVVTDYRAAIQITGTGV